MYRTLEYLRGISDDDARRLRARGIQHTNRLLHRTSLSIDRERLSKRSGISTDRLLEFAHQCTLLEVSGMDRFLPIIPVSVVGSEEIYPMVADIAPVAKFFGLPYFPITPFWPLLGPLGMIPLPSKWRIQFHAPIHVEEHPPEAADDQNLVMALADDVRDVIQQGVYDNLKLRRGVFL